MDYIQVGQADIWTPDVTVGNVYLANWHLDQTGGTAVRVDREGNVEWTVKLLILTNCYILVTYYPFDTQVCEIQLTTEQSPLDEILLVDANEVANISALRHFTQDGTWEMLGYTTTSSTSEDGKNRHVITFSFYLSRRYYTFFIVFRLGVKNKSIHVVGLPNIY